MKLAAFALLLISASATAAPLTVPVGETWLFSLDRGDPAHARKVDATAKPARGEIKVSVRGLLGTMMTITNNSTQGYSLKAELVRGDGKAVTARTCTLPPGNQPTLESWPQKAAAVRISEFKPATGGRC